MTGSGGAVRALREGDRDAVLGVLRAAFGGAEESQLVEALWAAKAMAIERVAEADGGLAGYCAFSEVSAEPECRGLLLGLAPVAVAPGHQRRGLGAALIEAGLEACRAMNAALIVVLGAPDYYRRFGFEPASGKNVTWAGMEAGDAFQLIDLKGVIGGARREISYHPAFAKV